MAIGGFDGSTYLKTCEIYDPDANVWKLSGSMLYRRLGGGVGVVKVTKESSSTDSRVQSMTPSSRYHQFYRSIEFILTSFQDKTHLGTTPPNIQRPTAYNTSTQNHNTNTNNSWPFILSPMTSILTNAGANPPPTTYHLPSTSSNRPIQSLPPPASSTNTISIATITTSDSLINDLNHFGSGAEATTPTSPTSRSIRSSLGAAAADMTSNNQRNTSPSSSVKLVDV